MLKYLASIIKDIARTVEYPTLGKCKENWSKSDVENEQRSEMGQKC